MTKKQKWFVMGAASVVLGLWLATPLVIMKLIPDDPSGQGTYGDLYGSVNALFSGLALIGVVAAILLQQTELSLSTKEQRKSASALSKQVELSADAARIQVLPGLIQMQKVRIKTIGGKSYKNFENYDYTEIMVELLLSNCLSEIAEIEEKVKNSQKDLEKLLAIHIAEGIRLNIKNLSDEVENLKRVTPEIELLLKYQRDLVEIYGKIASTKLESGDPVQ